ncbi:hypothetical protein TPS_09888 [Trichinella pseudospiralis]
MKVSQRKRRLLMSDNLFEAADGKKCSLSNSSCAILVIKNCNQNWHRITGQGRQNQEEHVGRGLLDFDEVETTSVSKNNSPRLKL